MKILHVIDSLVTGGAEKLLIDSLPLYKERGIIADVVLLNGKQHPFYKILKSKQCCEIFSLSLGSLYNPLLIFRLIPIIKKYDIIHVHLFPAQYWVVLAKIISFSKCKLIFTEHSTNNRRLENFLFRQIDKIVYKFYDKIICISSDVKNVLLSKINIKPAKLEIILNGIDLEYFKSSIAFDRNLFGYQKEDIILVMVAAFRKEKNHTDLLNALNLLDKKYKLILVGDGAERDNIKNLVKHNQLSDRVFFTGITTDVPRYVKMSDIGILSSHWEGFGLSALEIMACNIPVVVSNVEGLSNVVGDASLYFENGKINDLAYKITLLEDKNVYNKYIKKGEIRADLYSIKNTVNKTIFLYKHLMNEK